MIGSTLFFGLIALVFVLSAQTVAAFKKRAPVVGGENVADSEKFIDLGNFFNKPSAEEPAPATAAPAPVEEIVMDPVVSPEADLWASPSPAF